jgi:hypothetical protein
MRTNDLVTLLASGAGSVDTQAWKRRFALAIGCGVLGAVVLMLVLLGVRRDIAQATLQPMFWVKVVFATSLATIGVAAAVRLSIPGRKLGALPAMLALPILALWGLALLALTGAMPEARSHLFFGDTWATCPVFITVLSAPAFAAICWAMTGLAPTRPRVAGAACGFASGAIATSVYSLHCPEMAAPFIAFWYLLAMSVPTVTGALLGPRLLRW